MASVSDEETILQTNVICRESQGSITKARGVCNDVDNVRPILNDDVIECKEDQQFVIQPRRRQTLIYGVSQAPPIHLTILFAIQQLLVSIDTSLGASLLVSEVVCARYDDVIKTQILSSTMMMAGIATFIVTTFGIRLPIFQGPTIIYIINLAALAEGSEWSCEKVYQEASGVSLNTTSIPSLDVQNVTMVPRSVIYERIGQLSGSLIIAGIVHFLIGATGLVGILTRFIGPLTIVPAIVLVGLNIYKVTVKFSETSWLVASITAISCLTFSLLLSNKKTPIPQWSKNRGFHIFWYPFHQVFSILLGTLVGWGVSAIMTASGAFSDDRTSSEFLARTDARVDVIDRMPWFTFPYPGRFGGYSFSTSAFVNFLIITFISVMDSIGDYNATARVARVVPPPKYAFNRGMAVEGMMTMLSGTMGCCHGTVSHGQAIGIMGITKVTSRRVFQVTALLYVVLACLGKIGATIITIPYCVLGGIQIATVGIFIGVVLSYLKMVDLNSTRNMSVVGVSLLLGLVLPYWVNKHPDGIQTGLETLDAVITMCLSNPSLVGGVSACVMDNVFPGTRKERGLEVDELQVEGDSKTLTSDYEEGPEVYHLPYVRRYLSKFAFTKWIPVCDAARRHTGRVVGMDATQQNVVDIIQAFRYAHKGKE